MLFRDSKESVIMALDTLRTNKLRSGLTILGVMIGVTTVIVISSAINGLNNTISAQVQEWGVNNVIAFQFDVFGHRPTAEELARKKLTAEDSAAIRELPHVVASDPGLRYNSQGVFGGIDVKYGDRKMANTILEGDSIDYQKINNLDLIEGRLFSDTDELHRSNVVDLGYDTADYLFGNESALDKEVNISGSIFRVIGVFGKHKSNLGGGRNQEDNIAVFPLSTFRKIHPEQKDYWITTQVDDPKNKDLVIDEMTELLRRRRHVGPGKPDNFAIFAVDSLLRLWSQITSGLFLFMIAVSSVGLMVGGVGVMNIMLVSVTERTREIGVRKAIGATKRNILFQFTLEAMTLCAVGGAIGVLVGALLTMLVRMLVEFLPATLSTTWVLIALGVSCFIGLVFGIYPAWKAANLDPIEALRYE
jgi:putative ABC transport system permease protein